MDETKTEVFAMTKSTTTRTTPKTTRQTVRIGGVRTVITTKGGKVTTKVADKLEWELQAAQVKRLRAMPEYGRLFLLAGDMNAAKRGATATAQATASGMTPGEADLRIYLVGGRLGLIENKVGSAPLTASQKERHPKLAAIGHPVTVIRATTETEAADRAEALVRQWLAANDNGTVTTQEQDQKEFQPKHQPTA